jgi:hypothetical protein
LDLDEVEADIRDHVREAASRSGSGAIGRDEVDEVLDRLGAPSRWLDGVEAGPGEARRGDPGEAADGVGRVLRRPWLVFVLTIVGLGLFPWVGPLVLLAAWLLARSVAGDVAGQQDPAGSAPWLVRPVLVLGSAILAVLLLLWPVPPLLDVGARIGEGARRLSPSLMGVGLWWIALGQLVRWKTERFRWLLTPFPLRSSHASRLSWLGVLATVVGLAMYLSTL